MEANLKDLAAIAAMQALLPVHITMASYSPEELAKSAYKIARAMVSESIADRRSRMTPEEWDDFEAWQAQRGRKK